MQARPLGDVGDAGPGIGIARAPGGLLPRQVSRRRLARDRDELQPPVLERLALEAHGEVGGVAPDEFQALETSRQELLGHLEAPVRVGVTDSDMRGVGIEDRAAVPVLRRLLVHHFPVAHQGEPQRGLGEGRGRCDPGDRVFRLRSEHAGEGRARIGRNAVHQEVTPRGLADLLGAEGVRDPGGGLVPGDRQEPGEEAVAVDPLEDPLLDHVVGVAVGRRKRLEEGLREVRRADVERGTRWPGVIGRPRPRGAAENGERLGGAEQAC